MADITKDRIVLILGASAVPFYEVMEHLSDSAPTWLTLVPIEKHPKELELAKTNSKDYIFPHERQFKITHSMMIGTVDELITNFKESLTRVFNALGEHNDLQKQSELFARHNINGLTHVSTVDSKTYQDREDLRCRKQNYTNKQDITVRDKLLRLVASYSDFSSDVDSITKLIDALTVLRNDTYNTNNINYVKAHGFNRQTMLELITDFSTFHGKKPGKVYLTKEQREDIHCASLFKSYGISVKEHSEGPILE